MRKMSNFLITVALHISCYVSIDPITSFLISYYVCSRKSMNLISLFFLLFIMCSDKLKKHISTIIGISGNILRKNCPCQENTTTSSDWAVKKKTKSILPGTQQHGRTQNFGQTKALQKKIGSQVSI